MSNPRRLHTNSRKYSRLSPRRIFPALAQGLMFAIPVVGTPLLFYLVTFPGERTANRWQDVHILFPFLLAGGLITLLVAAAHWLRNPATRSTTPFDERGAEQPPRFERRLDTFLATDVTPGEPVPAGSRMPFYLAVTTLERCRAKSAELIRALLQRLHQRLQS